MQHHRESDQHTAGIAEFTDLVSQALQLQFQRAVTLVVFQFLGQLPVDRGIAGLNGLHDALAFNYDAAAEQFMLI